MSGGQDAAQRKSNCIKDAIEYRHFKINSYLCNPKGISMLKQIVVDKVMARQLWKLGFKEPTLSYYDVDGQLQNAEGDTLELKDYNAPKRLQCPQANARSRCQMLCSTDFVSRPGLAAPEEAS